MLTPSVTSHGLKDSARQDNPKGKGRKAEEKNVDAAGTSKVSFVRRNKTTTPSPAARICNALKDPLRGLAQQGFQVEVALHAGVQNMTVDLSHI